MNAHRDPSILGVFATLILLLTALGGVATAQAQSVDAVIDAMKAQYQQQMETVDTYIIETDAYTSYHRKVTRNGEAVYETETRWNEDERLFGADASPSLQPGLSQLDTLAMHSTYLGTETVDGRAAHVLLVDDPSALSDEFSASPEDMEDDMEGEMRLYVDAERYVPLRMKFDVQVEQGGQMRAMQPRIDFSDYRTVDGLTLPWKMEMTMENVNASMGPEEREEARRGLKELEAQMALKELEAQIKDMPEEQRQMMEGLMEQQMEQMRKIIDEGTINFTVDVQDVRVNAPIPDGVFSDDG